MTEFLKYPHLERRRVWHEFVSEEIMNILKKYKNPKINFRFLQSLVTQEVKKEIGI